MTLANLLLMIPLLIIQQATTTISTRGKTSKSTYYCMGTAFLSHISWVTSNAFALWRVGESMKDGVTLLGVFTILWYGTWATVGNGVGQKLAIWFEKRYRIE